MFTADHPLLVQADGSILVDAHHDRYDEVRTALAPYAELVSAPEHVHTYRLSPVSVWNALAMGRTSDDVKIDVGRYARYGIPPNVLSNVDGWCSRWPSSTGPASCSRRASARRTPRPSSSSTGSRRSAARSERTRRGTPRGRELCCPPRP